MITDDEVKDAIELYDLAMSGDYDAINKAIELFRNAIFGDVNANGLACGIENELKRRKHSKEQKKD